MPSPMEVSGSPGFPQERTGKSLAKSIDAVHFAGSDYVWEHPSQGSRSYYIYAAVLQG